MAGAGACFPAARCDLVSEDGTELLPAVPVDDDRGHGTGGGAAQHVPAAALQLTALKDGQPDARTGGQPDQQRGPPAT